MAASTTKNCRRIEIVTLSPVLAAKRGLLLRERWMDEALERRTHHPSSPARASCASRRRVSRSNLPAHRTIPQGRTATQERRPTTLSIRPQGSSGIRHHVWVMEATDTSSLAREAALVSRREATGGIGQCA
jgi:hypothetical protein